MTFANPDGMTVERLLRDTRCMRKCLNPDGTPLPKYHPTARFTGRRVPYPAYLRVDVIDYREIECLCCKGFLRPVSLKDYSPEDCMALFGSKALPIDTLMYECVVCTYNMHAAKDLIR